MNREEILTRSCEEEKKVIVTSVVWGILAIAVTVAHIYTLVT